VNARKITRDLFLMKTPCKSLLLWDCPFIFGILERGYWRKQFPFRYLFLLIPNRSFSSCFKILIERGYSRFYWRKKFSFLHLFKLRIVNHVDSIYIIKIMLFWHKYFFKKKINKLRAKFYLGQPGREFIWSN
jgi:hypothetical protein